MVENEILATDNVTSEPVAQQKTFSQDEMNKIIGREKSQARESGRREAEEKYQRDLEGLNAQRLQQQQRNAEVPRQVDADAIYQQVTEKWNRDQEQMKREMEERKQKEHMTQVANNYLSNVALGKTAYEDYDEVTKDFDASAFPQITYLLAGNPNAADVLYELSKNPSKLVMINALSQTSPRMAQSELLKLSQSIVANKEALSDSQSQSVSEPLDRLNPSRIAGSNGKMSIRDLRNQPWLKG